MIKFCNSFGNKYAKVYPPIFSKALAVTDFAASVFSVTLPVHALSFNFYYTNADPNVIGQTFNTIGQTFNTTPNSTLLTANGVMDINRNAGESFTLADISNVNINVTDGTRSFNFTSWLEAGGVIAGDGMSASFDAVGNRFAFNNSFTNFFGCRTFFCADNNDPSQFVVEFNNNFYELDYNNQANALAAFQINAVPVPFEFSPAVGVVGLGVLFGVRKFISKKVNKNNCG